MSSAGFVVALALALVASSRCSGVPQNQSLRIDFDLRTTNGKLSLEVSDLTNGSIPGNGYYTKFQSPDAINSKVIPFTAQFGAQEFQNYHEKPLVGQFFIRRFMFGAPLGDFPPDYQVSFSALNHTDAGPKWFIRIRYIGDFDCPYQCTEDGPNSANSLKKIICN